MMKKRMFALATLGVILMIGGGIGAALNFRAAEKQVTTITDENYQIKDKKNQQKLVLELDITNQNRDYNLDLNIVPSEDDQFSLHNTSYNPNKRPSLKWDISEKNGQTNVKIKYDEVKQKAANFNLDPWSLQYSPITIMLPTGYEEIEITSPNNQFNSLNLNDLKGKSMTLVGLENQTNFMNVQLSNLTITNDSGNTNLYSTKVKEDIKITSESGNISFENVIAKNIYTKTSDSSIRLYDVIANTELESEYGDINLTDLVGLTKAKTTRGMIDFDQETLKDELDLTTESGDIRVMLREKSDKFDLTADSQTGKINFFGKSSEGSFKTNQSGPKVSLAAKSGNILVTTYDADNYGDDYYEDFGDEDFE